MEIFSLSGKNAVVLGGTGVLGSEICRGLAGFGASVAVTSRSLDRARGLATEVEALGVKSLGYQADATREESLRETCAQILQEFGSIDILVNAVGGNRPDATVSDAVGFFDLPQAAMQNVVNLNLFAGAVLPSQVFGQAMAGNPNGGSIINITSMCGFRPLTRVVGYSAAKAAVSNFTQWLAVYLAQDGHTSLRVNAISPGFFLTEQNRFLLTDEETGALTKRGRSILDHTPMGRFGDPADLVGAVVWLASDASKFVTGTVVAIDGGFSAFSGV